MTDPATSRVHSHATARTPLRVLHMVDVLTLAGMEYGVIKLVNRLDPNRFRAHIGCLRIQTPETKSLLDPSIPVFEFHKRPGRDWRIIRDLASLLKRERIDVAHSHNWGTYFYTVAAAKLAGTPIVVHGEHGREGDAIPARQILLSRHLAQGVQHFVAVSKSLYHDLITRWGLRPEHITYIPNGVDTDAFGQAYELGPLRAEFGLTDGQPVILSIGRYRPVKDHPTLVHAFAHVYRRHPDARLIIVGGADSTFHEISEKYRRESQAVAEQEGIAHAVRYSGDRRDVPQLLALCDVYTNTSTFEGMSNTILEAMASRKPVVATAVGGTPHIVQDGATGFLGSAGDHESLGRHMERLLSDRALARRMGEAGRAAVERDHSMSAMIRANSELYQELHARWESRRQVPLQMQVKRLVSHGCRWAGVIGGYARSHARCLKILTYHRVVPHHIGRDYPLQSMLMARDHFEAQMAHLSRHYRVLPFHDAIKRLQADELPPRSVAVTFDDGYADNCQYAWPIMKKYGIPGLVFVVTGVLDRTHYLWWDAIWKAMPTLVRLAGEGHDQLKGLPEEAMTILQRGAHTQDVHAAVRSMGDYVNSLPRATRLPLLEGLLRHTNARGVTDELMMTWDQVRTLSCEGMEIGSHTNTHVFVDELDAAGIQDEVAGSLHRLEAELKTRIRFFSYPKGRIGESVKSAFKGLGIEAAVSTDAGQNKPTEDLYHLRRIDAGLCRTPGRFDSAVFDAELNGVFDSLR